MFYTSDYWCVVGCSWAAVLYVVISRSLFIFCKVGTDLARTWPHLLHIITKSINISL